ncbi:MAG: caspase family protein [Gemmataceae bacterium]|nr:caspase family protein [Gemmataceae bacterium]
MPVSPRLTLPFAGLACCAILALPSAPAEQATQVKEGNRHALLVGCTTYPGLAKRFQLQGPANDVVLMRQVLMTRFGFPDAAIVTLSEAAGADRRPTRANIKREFERLARVAGKGDQVVILMAGHGSQQPDQAPYDEPDGLDEIFLPADCGAWDGGQGAVKNSIVDDELEGWCKAITDRGASLWVVVDSCHSGTVLRGGDEVAREIPPDELIPRAALDRARREAADRQRTRGAGQVPAPKQPPRLVGIYAAQPHEPTVERTMPPDGTGKRRYGLLTYTLCQVLTQATSPVTYRELAQRIHAQYVHWGRTGPTPLIEGTDLDREVLGTKTWPGRSRFALVGDAENGWKVNAGALHGLTEGSILAVYPPAGKAGAGKPVGHVRITRTGPLDADVAPCAHAGVAAPKHLPADGRCEPVYLDFGVHRMKVAFEHGKSPSEPLQRLEQQARKLAKDPGAVFTVVDDAGRAGWVVQEEGGKLYLLPGEVARRAGPRQEASPARFALDGDTPAAKLRDALERIHRAQGLLALGAAPAEEVARGEAAVDVEAVMLKLRGKADPRGEPVAWKDRGVQLAAGDHVAWRLTNRSRFAVDVSLLFIDSGHGIYAVFPRPGTTADNRLLPGQTFRTGAVRVNAKTTGLEHMLVIAVRADGPPVDFTCLAQPTLERAEQAATRGAARQTLASPLGRLFQNALYARGATRGLDAEAIDNHALRLLSWRVVPGGAKAGNR